MTIKSKRFYFNSDHQQQTDAKMPLTQILTEQRARIPPVSRIFYRTSQQPAIVTAGLHEPKTPIRPRTSYESCFSTRDCLIPKTGLATCTIAFRLIWHLVIELTFSFFDETMPKMPIQRESNCSEEENGTSPSPVDLSCVQVPSSEETRLTKITSFLGIGGSHHIIPGKPGSGYSTNRMINQTVTLELTEQDDMTMVAITKESKMVSNTNNHKIINNGDEPNPPKWPDSVVIVYDTDSKEEILAKVKPTQDPYDDEKKTFNSGHHFSTYRYAVMFTPGIYKGIDLEVGYYSQVLGLGRTPQDVRFVDCLYGPYVPALNRHLDPMHNGSSLDTFWRSAENFQVQASKGMLWAVSQAAPLRRIHVQGNLKLSDGAAYSSGGHIANSIVEGTIDRGTQQQFMHRNVQFKDTENGAWSMVYSGCTTTGTGELQPNNGKDGTCAITVVSSPPLRMEKPYIAFRPTESSDHKTKIGDGTFALHVPKPLLASSNPQLVVGPLLDGSHEEVRDFTWVRVVAPDEPVGRIQEALDQGKDVVLAPGIFALKKTLELSKPGQVFLGIGLATLIAPTDGSPCIHVASGVPGVRVAGVMLEASERDSISCGQLSSLLEWGEPGVKDSGTHDRPGGLFDVFCRVGGYTRTEKEDGTPLSADEIKKVRKSVSVDAMVRIHSGHVYGDNLWLWRADHAILTKTEKANYPSISPIYHQAEQDEFRVGTGLTVTGDDVQIYGLAVEHANGHQTVWTGERGLVVFYQCELPYGVTQETFGDRNFRGYLVGDNVRTHTLHAPGVYSNFRNERVQVLAAIQHPSSPSIDIVHPFTVRLDNCFGIQSVVMVTDGGPASKQSLPVRPWT